MNRKGKTVLKDLFADWKKQKFVVADKEIFKDSNNDAHLVILTDVAFWAGHIDECNQWCADHDCILQGMTVCIPTDELLTMFALRWS